MPGPTRFIALRTEWRELYAIMVAWLGVRVDGYDSDYACLLVRSHRLTATA